MRFMRWSQGVLGITGRRAEAKRQEALKGKATSGHLDSSERSAAFSKARGKRAGKLPK